MLIELLRHGETALAGSLRGSLDDELTPAGWQQMHRACQTPGAWQHIISSPLRRCAAFAAELGARLNTPVSLEPGLCELHFGEWEGQYPADLMREHADTLAAFWRDPYACTPPGGEPVLTFEKRVLASLDDLALRHADDKVLVITHGGVMRLLLARAQGLPREQLLQVQVALAERVLLRRHPDGDLEQL
ncbi:alpha-ribazole phosphatase family protein [Pseudomonas sp. NyZ704]|nr:alpha-ribazole phosphatase family protein [Pseudomonas sp. NyZ704]